MGPDSRLSVGHPDGIGREPNGARRLRLQACLYALRRNPDRAVPARELAIYCNMAQMQPETRRRRVRELVKQLHDFGHRICADDHCSKGGYWIARSDAEWTAYRSARAIKKRFGFVIDRRMADAANDRQSGQRTMFGKFEKAGCGMVNAEGGAW